jgi:UDP-sulfoquinovose synthase
MRVLILGGDGYLGWTQAMYLSGKGHDIFIYDNLMRRHFDLAHGFDSLVPILTLHKRVALWEKLNARRIRFKVASTLDYACLSRVFQEFRPEAVVHFAEQRTAPYSMIDREHANFTMHNNIEGTLNVLYALKECAPACHLVKLGTMGEYGTPNIDIEEGYIDIKHKGREDTFLYPKNPGSFYHLTKVHDTNNIKKCCDWWGLKATDLNQGVVYGSYGEECLDPRLATRFDYDQVYGTALNRFCVQAAVGYPLTVYGTGGQTRSFINIRDTVRCIELALLNPPQSGELRIFNQYTECFSVLRLAEKVNRLAARMGLKSKIRHLANPRIEAEKHYYNPAAAHLKKLGWKPICLGDEEIIGFIKLALQYQDRIDMDLIKPTVDWRRTSNVVEPPRKKRAR